MGDYPWVTQQGGESVAASMANAMIAQQMIADGIDPVSGKLVPVKYGGKVIGYHDTSRPWPSTEECREYVKDVDPDDCQGMFY
jgi:hypothetical protein